MPDTNDPQPPAVEAHAEPTQATDISYEDFHKLADSFIEELQQKLEKMQENNEGVDVEYSVRYSQYEITRE